jgi:hypothetical protein
MEMKSEKNAVQTARLTPDSRGCVFAHTPNTGITIGVLSASEPSSLALLAAGVAGMAARRARRERTK